MNFGLKLEQIWLKQKTIINDNHFKYVYIMYIMNLANFKKSLFYNPSLCHINQHFTNWNQINIYQLMIEGFLDKQTPKKASIYKISLEDINSKLLMLEDYLPKS